jgi:hypothetical protein
MQIVRQHTTPRCMRHSTCRFDWQREVTAHRKSRLDSQAEIANGTGFSIASCLRGFVRAED